MQLAAAEVSGPANAQLAPEPFSVSLGVNAQLTLLPEGVQAGLNVGGVTSTIVNVAVEEPALPSVSVPLTVKVYAPGARPV